MEGLDTNYKIPEGYHLGCTSCNAVFKDVVAAADHSVECDDSPVPFEDLDSVEKKNKYPYKVRRPRRIRTWTREYEATMLACLRRNVEMIGHARAQKGIKHYTTVMDLLTKEMQKSIGDWLTRKAVIRKWLSLLRRARDYDTLSNRFPKLGYLNLDPPEFYGTIKEIEKEIENVKVREQQRQREMDDHYEGEDAANRVKEALGLPSNASIQTFKVEPDEYTMEANQEQKLIEVIDIGNSMIRKDILVSVLNLLEQENVSPAEVGEKFDMKEDFVELIRQKKEFLMERLERCSLCHLLLENREELVNHELQCSDKNRWLGFKYYTDKMEDKPEGDSFQFHPATVEKLIQLVIDINPRENRKNAWKKIAYHLTSFQKGVTVKRCSQKWRNMVNQCRTYTQLLKWAEVHNYQHSRLPPEHYHKIMPFITSSDLKKSQASLDASHNENQPSDDGDSTGLNDYEENEDGMSTVAVEDLEESKTTPASSAPNTPLSPLGVAVRSIHSWEDMEEEGSSSGGGESNPNPAPASTATTLAQQAEHITRLEKKLDNVLVLISDLSKENQRLSKTGEPKSPSKLKHVIEQMTSITEVQAEANNYLGKQLETMMSMWDRHHQEHITAIKQLTKHLITRKYQQVPVTEVPDRRKIKLEEISEERSESPSMMSKPPLTKEQLESVRVSDSHPETIVSEVCDEIEKSKLVECIETVASLGKETGMAAEDKNKTQAPIREKKDAIALKRKAEKKIYIANSCAKRKRVLINVKSLVR